MQNVPGTALFSWSFENQWVRQYLAFFYFEQKDLLTSKMAEKLKCNLSVGPVNIFPNIWHLMQYV